MPTSEELYTALKKSVEKQLNEQAARHTRAGVFISRKLALDMAMAEQQEKLIQLAERFENENNEEVADMIRELANELPELMRELGLR